MQISPRLALVHIDRVTKIFNPGEVNEVTAVREVTLHVPECQFLVVIGGNGSGKSTLLNLVAGSVFPTQGRIAISEKDVTDVPEYERAGLIGHVFQDPLKGTAANLTIEENFSLAASRGRFRGLGPALDKALRSEIRDRLALLGLGLEDRMGAKVGLLSGGQRQAITLLMAVFRRPQVLLLDEHTAALDPRASRNIMQLTRDVIAGEKLTTLMITHNLAHVQENGDRSIMMNRGRIVRDMSRDELEKLNQEDLLGLFWEIQKEEEEPS
jgi:putative ABC transport system ATP-binding protein